MPLDSSKFERRLSQMIKHLEEHVPVLAEIEAIELQKDIAQRLPSKEEEYNALMVGEQAGNTPVPLTGDRSGDTDGRVRFEKDPGTWLQDVTVSPENISVTSIDGQTSIRIGNIQKLNQASVFRYTNLISDKIPEEHEAGPYWAYFEYGSSYIVLPTHRTSKDYPLRPDETSKIYTGIAKSITARRAYAPETLIPLLRERIIEGLKDLISHS